MQALTLVRVSSGRWHHSDNVNKIFWFCRSKWIDSVVYCCVFAELEKSNQVALSLEENMRQAEQERRDLEDARLRAEEARRIAEEAANLEKEERDRKVGLCTYSCLLFVYISSCLL